MLDDAHFLLAIGREDRMNEWLKSMAMVGIIVGRHEYNFYP